MPSMTSQFQQRNLTYSKRWDLLPVSRDPREPEFKKEINTLSKQRKDSFISLTVGDPVIFGLVNDAVAPAINKAVEKKLFMYPEISGVQEEYRLAVSEFEKKSQGMDYDPVNTVITAGVAGSMNVLHYALLDPGDEVLTFSPLHYVGTSSYVRTLGASVVQVPALESNGWIPASEDLRKAITPKTKLLMVNSPSNPQGAVYPDSILREIADIGSEFGIPIVSDEIYSLLTYDNVVAHPIGRFVKDNLLFTVSGVSKIFCAPGMRMGYICIKNDVEKFGKVADMVKRVGSMYGHASSSIPTPMMAAAAELYRSNLGSFRTVLDKLKERRALALKRIGEMPSISFVRPMGALYFFPKITTKKWIDEYSFLLDLARSESVAFTPGATFGMGAEGHFRGVFMAEPSILSEAMDRLERFLKKHV
jgi:alanine-synthesizing transaminase